MSRIQTNKSHSTVAYSQATRCISSPPDITISATELETMVKTQWYKRRCAPYLKLKDFLKSQRVSRSSGPTTTTSSPNSAKISSRPTAASTEKRLRKITRTFTPVQIEETFNRTADVAIKDGDSSSWSDYNKGVIMFDTGSVYNLVTVRFLETFDIAWEPSTDDTMIIQMDEKRLNCLGEVEGRWRTLNASQEGFRPRYEISTFKIVDVDAFELIIGSRTIKELEIFQLNCTFFGGFKAVPIRPDCKFEPF